MFWASHTTNNRTPLVAMPGDPDSKNGGVTARVVKATLEEYLPQIAGDGMIFAQDNAPTHTAATIQDWLIPWADEHGVELVDWPPYSPDLNPIENLWKILKYEIAENYPELAHMKKNATSKAALIEAAQSTWDEIENDLLKKLVESMPRRLAAVIAANGWYTKY